MESALKAGLGESEFTSPFLSKAYGILRERQDSGADISPASLMPALAPAEAQQISVIMQKPESVSSGRRALEDYIKKIRTERLRTAAEGEADIRELFSKIRETKGLGG
jgi:hypothetical protein